MIPICPYCRQDTGGNHEWGCPNYERQIYVMDTDRTEEPCPHCGKTRSEEGGER